MHHRSGVCASSAEAAVWVDASRGSCPWPEFEGIQAAACSPPPVPVTHACPPLIRCRLHNRSLLESIIPLAVLKAMDQDAGAYHGQHSVHDLGMESSELIANLRSMLMPFLHKLVFADCLLICTEELWD